MNTLLAAPSSLGVATNDSSGREEGAADLSLDVTNTLSAFTAFSQLTTRIEVEMQRVDILQERSYSSYSRFYFTSNRGK